MNQFMGILVQLARYAPRPLSPSFGREAPIDLTSRVVLGNLGSVNRAVERDLLSFRTGDLTLQLDNRDGAMDELFSSLSPTDRWMLDISLIGVTMFRGVVLGQGSVKFNRLDRSCELTAFGPTKILQDTSAESVKRTMGPYTVTTATSGSSTLTLNTTAGLLSQDSLHLSNEVNAEDVVVRQVTSPTQLTLESNLQNGYASGVPVTVNGEGYRYKDVNFLVRELFKAAEIPLREVRLGASQFAKLAPTEVNLEGLNLSPANPWGCPAEASGKVRVTLDDDGTYEQSTPDGAWTKIDANDKPWIDWSRYFKQGDPEPAMLLRNPIDFDEGSGGAGKDEFNHPHCSGFDFLSDPRVTYYIQGQTAIVGPQSLWKRTTTDGLAWTAPAEVIEVGGSAMSADNAAADLYGAEYDPSANGVYIHWVKNSTGDKFAHFVDLAGPTISDIRQGDDGARDTGHSYFGFCYVPELGYTICLRGKDGRGSIWEVAAFRGTQRLWVKPLPTVGTINPGPPTGGVGGDRPRVWMTQLARHLNGAIYGLMIKDAATHFWRTDDEFQTVIFGKVLAGPPKAFYFGGRIVGRYHIVGPKDGGFRGYQVAAPFFAGIVSFADYRGKSASDALNDLAVLSNAMYWVDEDLQGFFVSREFLPATRPEPVDIEPDTLELSEELQWDDSKQFVTVSGGGFEAEQGDKAFVNNDITISSDLIPNEPYASALAENFFEFYSKQRRAAEAEVAARGRRFQPLDRVLLRGLKWFVHELDHDLGEDRARLRLLEDI